MTLIKVFAKDIKLHDVIGEGQEIWCKVIHQDKITVYWGDIQGWKTKVVYDPLELVSVLRKI